MPPLPGLTPNGRRVCILRGLEKEIKTPDVAEAMKIALMIGDIRLYEEQVGVAGDVYILDASVATPQHFAKFTPALVKKFLICVQVSNGFISHLLVGKFFSNCSNSLPLFLLFIFKTEL